jgi:hypothetical protein
LTTELVGFRVRSMEVTHMPVLFDRMKCSKEDARKIIDIMLRAAAVMNFEVRGSSRLEVSMDLTACHCVGCPLDLEGLLTAKPSDLIHDVAGITAYINRETGELGDCFVPRYAKSNHV